MDNNKIDKPSLLKEDNAFLIVHFIYKPTQVLFDWAKAPEQGTSALYGKRGDGTMVFVNMKSGIMASFKDKKGTHKALKRNGKKIT